MVMNGVRKVGLAVSSALIFVSLSIVVFEGEITTEVWALLLLTPIPIGFALSKQNESQESFNELSNEWIREDSEDFHEDVGDPIEAGFDVPVL